MSLLQNKIPVRVNVFLIVNPPKSFGRIWNLTKPLLEKSFRDKVKIVQNTNDLSKYLAKGFLDFLPDDFEGVGLASTNTMVKDYVTYRIAVENELGHCRDVSSSSSAASSMAVCSSTSLARLPMRKGRAPWAASNTNLASDRSVCTTTTHLQRRAQRRSSDYGIIPTSSGSSVCGPTPSGNSSAAAPVRPSRAQRRGSGSHNFPTTGEQKRRSSGSHFPITTIGDQKQQQDPHGGDSSSELPSSIRPPRMLRRGSGSHGSTDPNQIPHQHLAQQQSSTKKAPKFEKRLSGLVRSNSITSLSSYKYVTFEDDRNNNKVAAPNKKPGERLGRRLSGLGSMTLPSVSSSSSSTPSTSNGKAAGRGEKMMVASGGAPRPVIKRQLSGSTLATDAEESTLTNISH
jgi:CRAL/TRIO domain